MHDNTESIIKKANKRMIILEKLFNLPIEDMNDNPGNLFYQHFSVNVDQLISQELDDNLNYVPDNLVWVL